MSSLLLQQSCTDNHPSRDLDPQFATGAASGTSGSGPRPTGGSSGTSGTGAGGTGVGGTGVGGESGAGGSGGDPCLDQCADPEACTAEEDILVGICRLYVLHCPDQPSDVMTDRGRGTPIPAGPAATSTATRPQLTEAQADDVYTIEEALRGGGDYTAEYTGMGAGGEGGGPAEPLGERTLTYESVDDWDPRGPIEDLSKVVPGIIVDPLGDPDNPRVFTSIQLAISTAVYVAGCPRVFILIKPGTYREKITVPAKTSTPPLTLYGLDRDPNRVVIVHRHSAAGDDPGGTRLSIQASATFTNSLPQPFQARNLTIANDYVAGTHEAPPSEQTAVALLSQADRALFDNVRILGHRHALYVKSTSTTEVSRAYFRNCYLEGDEDMILGRGAAVFDQCRIHSLGDRVSGGAITSPSTRVDNPHGVLIINSELTADANVTNVFLGHQWSEVEDDRSVGKTIVRNSILGAHIRASDPWAPTVRVTEKNRTPTDQVLYTSDDFYRPMAGLVPPEPYLAEFGNSGPGAAP